MHVSIPGLILILLHCALAGSAAPTVLMQTPVTLESGDAMLVALRTSEWLVTEWQLPGSSEPITSVKLHDLVEIRLTQEGEDPIGAWSKSHASDIHLVQRCDRLILYDAMHEGDVVYILYSFRCKVYCDRVEQNESGEYEVQETIEVLQQSDSGFRPYLMQTGKVFEHEDVIHIGFRTWGSSSTLRGRDHPYEFWTIEDDKATEIEDVKALESLRKEMSDVLDDESRPRMISQVQSPPFEVSD